MTFSPLARRITYVVVFEIFAIAFATILLATLSGGEAQGSLPVAVASSVAAVVWNFIYNRIDHPLAGPHHLDLDQLRKLLQGLRV